MITKVATKHMKYINFLLLVPCGIWWNFGFISVTTCNNLQTAPMVFSMCDGLAIYIYMVKVMGPGHKLKL